MPSTPASENHAVPAADLRRALKPTHGQIEENAEIVDPGTAERRIWREPFTGYMREIWMPGDGDGDAGAEYHDQKRPPDDIKQRWKLYQSTNFDPSLSRLDLDKAFPPRFVILDDRAAHEILESNIPRSYFTKFWAFDFGGHGSVRARRPHRGRAAICDPDADGNDKFHHGVCHNKKDKYFFTGEKNYQPVVWYNSAEESLKRKREFDLEEARKESDARKKSGYDKSHNQYTPSEQLLRTKTRVAREQLGRYVPSARSETAGSADPTPTPWAIASPSPLGRNSLPMASPPVATAGATSTTTSSPVRQRTRAPLPVINHQEGSSSDEDFPFYRRSTTSHTGRGPSQQRSAPGHPTPQPNAVLAASPSSYSAKEVIKSKDGEIAEKQRQIEENDRELEAAYRRIAELEQQVAMLMRGRS